MVGPGFDARGLHVPTLLAVARHLRWAADDRTLTPAERAPLETQASVVARGDLSAAPEGEP